VVEDEVEARATLEELVRGHPALALAGSAADGESATRALDELEPALVLLDVTLPERSGIEALRAARHRPEVIFTTASSAHAVTAFELGAVDFLLKPFGRHRFDAAIARVGARLAPGSGGRAAGGSDDPSALERLAAVQASAGAPYLQRIFARKEGALVPIPVAEIVRVEAQAEYVRLHTRRGRFLVRVTMRELAARLDPARFAQVHRCHVVNLDAVVRFRPVDDRRLQAMLDDGSSVIASRAASERLRDLAR
jgi:two-component system LytT family response regulator